MWFHSFSVLVLCAALGLAAGDSVCHAQPHGVRVLVVGVKKGNRYDARLTRALSDHVDRSGLGVVVSDTLSSSERTCSAQDCLEPLAQRLDAQLLISATVRQNAPGSHYIEIGLFDALRRAPFQGTTQCEQCGPAELLAKLSDATDRLLQQSRKESTESTNAKPADQSEARPEAKTESAPTSAAPQPEPISTKGSDTGTPVDKPVARSREIPTVSPENSESAPEPAKVLAASMVSKALPTPYVRTSRGYSGDRTALVALLSGLTAIGLGAGVLLNLMDMNLTGGSCRYAAAKQLCVHSSPALYGTGYGFGAASAIGLIFALAWPSDSRRIGSD